MVKNQGVMYPTVAHSLENGNERCDARFNAEMKISKNSENARLRATRQMAQRGNKHQIS